MKVLDEKRRRLVRDSAWNVELKSVDHDEFTITMRSGRHRLVLTIPNYEIRAFRKAFAHVAKKHRARAEAVEQLVVGEIAE